jgi:hypothetical protein
MAYFNLPKTCSFKDYVTRPVSENEETQFAKEVEAIEDLKIHELSTNASIPIVLFDDFPQEIIERVLEYCHPMDLLNLAWSGKQSRSYALKAIFGNPEKWFIVHYKSFLHANECILKARLDVQITQSSCLLAAKAVVNLKIGGAAFDWTMDNDIALFNNPILWGNIFSYFPSLEKIAFGAKRPLTDREWETIARFPSHVQVWLGYGPPRKEKLYRLHPQQKNQLLGKLHITQYIYLPPPTGPIHAFAKLVYSSREILKPYMLRNKLPADFDQNLQLLASTWFQNRRRSKKSLSTSEIVDGERWAWLSFNRDSELWKNLVDEAGNPGTPRRLKFNQSFLNPIIDAASVIPMDKQPNQSPLFLLMQHVMSLKS